MVQNICDISNWTLRMVYKRIFGQTSVTALLFLGLHDQVSLSVITPSILHLTLIQHCNQLPSYSTIRDYGKFLIQEVCCSLWLWHAHLRCKIQTTRVNYVIRKIEFHNSSRIKRDYFCWPGNEGWGSRSSGSSLLCQDAFEDEVHFRKKTTFFMNYKQYSELTEATQILHCEKLFYVFYPLKTKKFDFSMSYVEYIWKIQHWSNTM